MADLCILSCAILNQCALSRAGHPQNKDEDRGRALSTLSVAFDKLESQSHASSSRLFPVKRRKLSRPRSSESLPKSITIVAWTSWIVSIWYQSIKQDKDLYTSHRLSLASLIVLDCSWYPPVWLACSSCTKAVPA